MRALIQRRYGKPDSIRVADVETPVPDADEVRVRVHATSLHPDVWHTVTGRPWVMRLMGGGFLRPKVAIPGTDMSGTVEAVGSEVTRFRPGDAVFGETVSAYTWINGGAFAEYVTVPAANLAPKPDKVTFEQAASVPCSGFIALLNLPDEAWFGPTREVLINGAGGGVGAIALQISRARGATVTAVDHADKLDMLRDLGADRVIDYTREDFTRGAAHYDLVFDIPGNHGFAACRRVLKPDGRYVPIGHEHYGRSGRRIFGLLPYFITLMIRSRYNPQLGAGYKPMPDKGEAMAILAGLLAAGDLTPVIDSVYPLERFREAYHHLVEDTLRGKVLLSPLEQQGA